MLSDFTSNRIVIPIFIATIIIILLLYTPIVFPALFSSIVGSYSDTINNPFEFGHHTSILIISNIMILGFGFAYFLKSKWYHSPFIFTHSGKKIKPKEGTYIMFPSHIKHHVHKNRFKETRITLSGNLNIKKS